MKRTLALLAILGALAAPVVLAQGQGWGAQFSPSEARDARKQGLHVPFDEVEKTLRREYGRDGVLISADLYSQASGGAVYDIRWQTGDGRLVRVTVNAQTGDIVRGRSD